MKLRNSLVMTKFSLFVSFAVIFAFISETLTSEIINKSEKSWNCPPTAEVETSCQCDEVALSVLCNEATYSEIKIFFDKLKATNPDGVHVDLFRIENYPNSTLDVEIFSPCTFTPYCD